MVQETISRLCATFRGSVITPASSEYEVARKVYNGMIDRHPDVIARCANVADVRTALQFAREEGLKVAEAKLCARRPLQLSASFFELKKIRARERLQNGSETPRRRHAER
jgi:hypothetical protein